MTVSLPYLLTKSSLPSEAKLITGLVASINRNFAGFGRELFTDTGQYVIRFDAAGTELDVAPGAQAEVQGQTVVIPQAAEGGLTLDQRAMVCFAPATYYADRQALATAVSSAS